MTNPPQPPLFLLALSPGGGHACCHPLECPECGPASSHSVVGLVIGQWGKAPGKLSSCPQRTQSPAGKQDSNETQTPTTVLGRWEQAQDGPHSPPGDGTGRSRQKSKKKIQDGRYAQPLPRTNWNYN